MKRPLWQIQSAIEKEYWQYLMDCTHYVGTPPITPGDVFHFLLVRGFIQGKKFYDFIDSLPQLSFKDQIEMGRFYPLREGHIPMVICIGRKEKKGEQAQAKAGDQKTGG